MTYEKHAIVTGGAGFLGSHLCKTLLERGFWVSALDNLVTGDLAHLSSFQAHPRFCFLRWDVTQSFLKAPLAFSERHGVDTVFHFACPASPVDFEKIPFDILKVDSLGTFHTIEYALVHGARYVFASTSEVYGDPLQHPQKESYWGHVNSVGVRACYDEAKRFSEAAVITAIRGKATFSGKTYPPLDGRIVRIFNTYGPMMRILDGRVVPEFCLKALEGKPLPVFGDGLQTRSFCYVSDLIEGILKLLESSIQEPVNIGNPSEISLLELVKVLENVFGKKLKKTFLPARSDDPKKRCPDIFKAKKYLSWEPKVSLEEGLHKTVEYFQNVFKSSF